MSFDALAWASRQDCRNSLDKLVLLMLANYSDENHTTYPSYRTLAKLCHCTERTAMRAVKGLEELGLLTIEKRFTADGKQTSNRFRLAVGGDIHDRVGVTQTTPNTVRDIQDTNTPGGDTNDTPTSTPRTQAGYTPEFEQFWGLYPRNDGSKKKAFDIFKTVTVREVTVADLIQKTATYRQTTHGKDKKFIPHATTWLNQRRWETVEQAQQVTTTRNSLAG